MRAPRHGGLEVRVGTVVGADIVWDVDLSRLWDGVALWVMLWRQRQWRETGSEPEI